MCLSVEDDERTLKSKYSNEFFLEVKTVCVQLLSLDCPVRYSSNPAVTLATCGWVTEFTVLGLLCVCVCGVARIHH